MLPTRTEPRFIGGYAFITNMIPLHALVLILMGRFTNRLYIAYSSWYAVGTLASMQVPFVGFQPVRTSEHMGALGTPPVEIIHLLSAHALLQGYLVCYSWLHSQTLFARTLDPSNSSHCSDMRSWL
jgi:Oligosaccharyl transferase STT3, N-terminal